MFKGNNSFLSVRRLSPSLVVVAVPASVSASAVDVAVDVVVFVVPVDCGCS